MIPLTAAAIDAFRRQRVLQNEDRLANGDIYQADPRRPVFTDEIGAQLTPKAATNAFARLAKKAGIGTTSLHSTRHTAATHLIAGGIDVTTTAAILGHSTPTVTLSIYSHVVEGNESAAMDVLGERLEKMRTRVVEALENPDGYRMATAADSAKKKARRNGLSMVAGAQVQKAGFGPKSLVLENRWSKNPRQHAERPRASSRLNCFFGIIPDRAKIFEGSCNVFFGRLILVGGESAPDARGLAIVRL
jgi:hypothetical protein